MNVLLMESKPSRLKAASFGVSLTTGPSCSFSQLSRERDPLITVDPSSKGA